MAFMARGWMGIASVMLLAIVPGARAYGPDGHRLVGAIADARLAAEPAGARVRELLDGLTLEQASVLPDNIKAWDRKPPDDPNTWHLRDHPGLEKQLRAFWEANHAPGSDPERADHTVYHYTDVPVATPGVKYADARHGTGKRDIVQMLPYCVRVLRREVPETNERKITRAVALILIAHYVGDIHQPLHVGSQYFTMKGPADPDKVTAYPSQGGNLITLLLTGGSDREQRGGRTARMHSYWDGDAVRTAKALIRSDMLEQTPGRADVTDEDIARYLAAHEPNGWKTGLDGSPEACAQAWANEILPVARQAYERLTFTEIHLGSPGGARTRIVAEEKTPQPDGVPYAEWAGRVVGRELHLAGWRLAEVCRTSLTKEP